MTVREMSYLNVVAHATSNERASFIRKTYTHLAGAVLVFIALEWTLLVPLRAVTEPLVATMLGGSYSWLIVLGLFMLVGYIADRWAQSESSRPMQYVGLGLYVVAEAIIFLPLLYVAAYLTTPDVIPTAGILTAALFGGLTVTVFITRADFSFLRGALSIGAFIALGLILCSILFGFNLGMIFSFAMVALAGGYILYYTSNVMNEYRTDQHVAASLALFAAVALLFWYVLRIVMSLSRR